MGLLLSVSILVAGCKEKENLQVAKTGDTVKVHYTGKLVDGTVFDSSLQREPLKFTLGTGAVIPGFEKAVLGMKVGDSKTVTIPVADAYGPHRSDMVFDVKRTELPSNLSPKVGDNLTMQTSDGSKTNVVVTAVFEDRITIDANHSLAGKDLVFELKLIEIQ
ncbi:MAG: peptidylprolyl isomerase [Chloroflexi bacterium]|nr:peptidylprolyl isomerase [Chloroflexota bacterium]